MDDAERAIAVVRASLARADVVTAPPSGVSRDGSKAASVLRAARNLGLEAEGYRLELEELATVVKPAIVYVNENHFVVLEGMRRGRLHVNDPAGGRVVFTRDECAAIYSGIALTFAPGDAFRRGGERPRVTAHEASSPWWSQAAWRSRCLRW